MQADRCVCAALCAPGSVEAEVGRLQARIFEQYGLASAQALPPLVPLGFIEDELAPNPGRRGGARALLDGVQRSVRAPWQMSGGSLEWHEGYLFLTLDTGQAWTQARESLRALAHMAEPGFFPAAEGFFLGCGDAPVEQRSSMRLETPRISTSSATITLLRLSAPSGAAEFWREVYWEILEERPLRGRRET